MNIYLFLLIVVLVAFVVVVVFRQLNRPDPRHPHHWPANPESVVGPFNDGSGSGHSHDASHAGHDGGADGGVGSH